MTIRTPDQGPSVSRPDDQEIGKWYPRLFRTALRLTGRYDDAADLTQQAFSKALAAWESFDGGNLRTTWLHQILINCVRDWARRSAVRAAGPLHECELHLADGVGADGAARMEAEEELAALRAAVGDLPPPTRCAFVMTVLDGYSYRQAAEILAVPEGTIASRVHQARERLRATVRGRFEEV